MHAAWMQGLIHSLILGTLTYTDYGLRTTVGRVLPKSGAIS